MTCKFADNAFDSEPVRTPLSLTGKLAQTIEYLLAVHYRRNTCRSIDDAAALVDDECPPFRGDFSWNAHGVTVIVNNLLTIGVFHHCLSAIAQRNTKLAG